MANSTLITDYIGVGLAAARPATPPVAAGCLALWYSTDTTELDGWNGAAWVMLTVGAAVGWAAGHVTAIHSGLTITANTLVPDWQAGTVSAIGSGLTITTGTLSSSGATAADHGAVINSGTVQIEQSVTLNGTASSTTTIGPGSGTRHVILNMPATGGTVTLAAAPAYAWQTAVLHILQGATTPGTISLNSGFVLGTDITGVTLTGTAGKWDDIVLVAPDTSHFRVEAVNHGFST